MSAQPQLDGDEPEQHCCRLCHRPVSSQEARRTGIGGGCRRKGRHRRGPVAARRAERFVVDQDPLPEAD